jgi:hypothetical protein
MVTPSCGINSLNIDAYRTPSQHLIANSKEHICYGREMALRHFIKISIPIKPSEAACGREGILIRFAIQMNLVCQYIDIAGDFKQWRNQKNLERA